MEDYVTLERSDDIMIVRFDRQGALNAFDQKMITELTDTAKLLAEDLTVRSVVLTGASAAFSSGIDLKDGQNGTSMQRATLRFEDGSIVVCGCVRPGRICLKLPLPQPRA